MVRKVKKISHGPEFVVGALTPDVLTANVDDYSPAGLSSATILRLDGSTDDWTISGIATGTNGRKLYIFNVGDTYSLTLLHASTSSSAANRILCPGAQPKAIRPNGCCELIYDATSSRWRVVGESLF